MSKKTIIGIDIGGSTTKIVGFRQNGTQNHLIEPLFVRATDALTSAYGAFGKFTVQNDLSLSDIDQVLMTGVGSSFIDKPLYSLPCRKVSEFQCVGLGGLYLSGLEEAIVVSMGTGTALIHAVRTEKGTLTEYLGGTGVGGGTLLGLSRQMLGVDSVDHLEQLAEDGDLSKVDLRIGDISGDHNFEIKETITASNFGKLSDIANKNDIALGITNMVAETIAMLAIFAARNFRVKNVVLTGNLTAMPTVARVFEGLEETFGVRFLIPEQAQFATVIGAALSNSPQEA